MSARRYPPPPPGNARLPWRIRLRSWRARGGGRRLLRRVDEAAIVGWVMMFALALMMLVLGSIGALTREQPGTGQQCQLIANVWRCTGITPASSSSSGGN